jgi:very-short-patch-repair endonuclease
MFERPGNVRGAMGRARRLRREMTASEKSLWEALRALKLHIRRQVPMGRYIADFAHHASGLVIEVDGARHDLPEEQLHDAERDAWFRTQGYRTLRIRDREAYGDPFAVAERIRQEIQKALSEKPFGFGQPAIQTEDN